MSSGQDPPLFTGESQQPRKGPLRNLVTPKRPRVAQPTYASFSGVPPVTQTTFRRPPPPRDVEQQFSQPTSWSTEPIGTGLATSSRSPAHAGPKPGYSGVTSKSTTSSPRTRRTPKSIPTHSPKIGQVI